MELQLNVIIILMNCIFVSGSYRRKGMKLVQYLIGIVPSISIGKRIDELRLKWGYIATEPHITIKTPEGLDANNLWINEVKNIIHSMEPFDITIGDVGFFGESVLYYQIHAEKINKLHKRLVKAVHPNYEKVNNSYEMDMYVPHLTIMKHKKRFENLPLRQIANEEVLKGNIVFRPKCIRIYSRQNSKENFKSYLDVDFCKVSY
jgi:2'-5' RNA ligase